MDNFVEQYEDSQHREILADWLRARDLPHNLSENLPSIGAVIRDSYGYFMAMGFLRQCEGGLVILDSVITNPREEPSKRNAAMDILTNTLIRLAANMGFKQMSAFTSDKNTILRASRLGFSISNQRVIQFDLCQGLLDTSEATALLPCSIQELS